MIHAITPGLAIYQIVVDKLATNLDLGFSLLYINNN